LEDVNNVNISLTSQGGDVRPISGPRGNDAGEGRGKQNGYSSGPCIEDRRLSIRWSLDRSSDVGRALLAATRRLREVEIDTAQLDASVLLSTVLGVNKAWLYAHPTRQLNESEIKRFEDLVRRRMCHEPVAYLVGFKPFYGLDITVDSHVLIPRPETELLVERVLAHAQVLVRDGTRPVVADIGTGSGAIAVAIAVHAPDVVVYATELSEDALQVAAQNVWRYGVGDQVHLIPGQLARRLPEAVHIVVANLPYVATRQLDTLPPQVRNFEPVLALDGGEDGCDVIRALLEDLGRRDGLSRLRPGGVVFLEIGADQGPRVRDIALQCIPGCECAVHADYAGLDRIAVITT
jgi:release factor glutamine methyltransferase